MIDADNRDGVLQFIARADRARRQRVLSDAHGGRELRFPPPLPTMRRICWWSTTTAAFAICCRASCSPRAIGSPPPKSRRTARAKLEGLRFDLLILDVMMPGETGFELARTLRTSSSVPILMLTARGEAESRIEGLEIGADDYVGKPFEPRELSLRIANILKRTRPARGAAGRDGALRRFRVPRRARRTAQRGDEIIHLTDREREMLRVLAATPGETVPRLALAGSGGDNGSRSASAPSTCRSTACAARSSAIPPIRCWCRPCAASATGW